MSSASYVPMPFAPGWLLERHLGWRVVGQRPDLKLLARRRGPFRQFLLLSRGSRQPAELEALLRRAGFAAWRSSLVWNDFEDQGGGPARVLAGCPLTRAEQARWFGVGTFVIDLSLDEGSLLARMASRERGAVRRASALGVAREFVPRPGTPQLAEFLALYRPLALERGLELPELGLLARINAAGDLALARVSGADGRALVVNLIYRQAELAWFLYGARDPAVPGWAGPAAQWATIQALKSAGTRFYDLGQVASCDPHDGIYRFKSALGGCFLSHGQEYRHEAPLLRLAKRLRGLATRFARPRAAVGA